MDKSQIFISRAIIDKNNRYAGFLLSNGNAVKFVNAKDIIKLCNKHKIKGIHSITSSGTIRVSKDVPRVYVKSKDNDAILNERQNENIRSQILNEKKVLIYHGSITGIQGEIDPNKNNNLCDFGNGFYTGENLAQAENRVCNFSNPIIYAFDFNLNNLNTYMFEDDLLWALFVGYNRNKIDLSGYTNLKRKLDAILSHDVIIGKIADDKISSVYSEFIAGDITSEVLVKALKLVKYGNQLVFRTNRACNSLIKKYEYRLTKSMGKQSMLWGIKAKEDMDNSLDKIKKQYRREGSFIDECLEAYNK